MAQGGTVRTGAAGEFYVAARMSELGWSVGILPPGTAMHDLLATKPDASERPIAVQVKASVGGRHRGFPVSDPPPALADHEWYVLVDLDPGQREPPKMYCVPAYLMDVFAWALWQRKARTAPQIGIRFQDFWAYEDRFDLLDRPARKVEWDLVGDFWTRWLVAADQDVLGDCPRSRQELPVRS